MTAPWEDMAEMVQARYLAGQFDQLTGDNMEKALAFLGASAGERAMAMEIMKQASADLLDAEKWLVTVKETLPDLILLDRSMMEDFSKSVVEQTKRDLREALPERIADVIDDGVNWHAFYMMPGRTEVSLILEGVRDGLRFRLSDGYREDVGVLEGDRLKAARNPDGTYSADRIFSARWGNLVKSLSLMVQESEE
jgi:hypothetical protein